MKPEKVERELLLKVLQMMKASIGGPVMAADHVRICKDGVFAPSMRDISLSYVMPVGIQNLDACPHHGLLSSALKSLGSDLVDLEFVDESTELIVSSGRSKWRVPCIPYDTWKGCYEKVSRDEPVLPAMMLDKDVFAFFPAFCTANDSMSWMANAVIAKTGIGAFCTAACSIYIPDSWGYDGGTISIDVNGLVSMNTIGDEVDMYKNGATTDEWNLRWATYNKNLTIDPVGHMLNMFDRDGVERIRFNRQGWDDVVRALINTAAQTPGELVYVTFDIKKDFADVSIYVHNPGKMILFNSTVECDGPTEMSATFSKKIFLMAWRPVSTGVNDVSVDVVKNGRGGYFFRHELERDYGVVYTLVASTQPQ